MSDLRSSTHANPSPMTDRQLDKLAKRPGAGFHDARPTPHPDSAEGKRRRADLDREIAAAVTEDDKGIRTPVIPEVGVSFHDVKPAPLNLIDGKTATEDRQTFEVPHGCVPVLDAEGRATGGFVLGSLADKLPGFQPIYQDESKQVIIAVRSIAMPKAAIDKMESALTAALQPPLLDMDVPGYEPLRRVLEEAYNQSARGKGRERHAKEKPFIQQPIMEIARMVGVGGHTYQISKKAQEATTMASRGQHAAAKAELLGVIVYAAAAYLWIEEQE